MHMTSSPVRGAAAIAAGASLLALLTGCSSNSPSTSASDTAGATAAPVPGASAGATAAPAGDSGTQNSASTSTGTTSNSTGGTTSKSTGGGSTGQSSDACTVSQLKLSVGSDNPGAGQENFPLVLTNDSSTTCTIYGYPGVEFQDSAHNAVTPDPARESGSTKTLLSLGSGDSAWAPLSFGNPSISGANTVTPRFIIVTPPGETHSLVADWTQGAVPKSGNSSTINVGTFSPGTGG